MRRLSLAGPAVAGLLAGLLAGCGAPPPPPPAVPPPPPVPIFTTAGELTKAITDRWLADRTVRLVLNGTVPGAAPVDGVAAWALAPGGSSVSLSEQVPGPDGDPMGITLLVRPEETLVKLGDATRQTSGRRWTRVGPGAATALVRGFVPLARTLRTYTDPGGLAGYLGPATIEAATPDNLGAARAVRYDMAVGPERARLWLDARGRVVRLHVERPGRDALSLDAGYQDWGKPVVVAQPVPGEITP